MFPNDKKKSVLVVFDSQTEKFKNIFSSEKTLFDYVKNNFTLSKGYLEITKKLLRINKMVTIKALDIIVKRIYLD
jgi:hypothetical protein